MTISKLAKELFANRGGIDKHNLNNILQLVSQNDDHQETFATSDYYDIENMLSSFKKCKGDFSMLTLNIDGINTKFNELTAFLKQLDDENFTFSAILLQETRLSDEDCKSDFINIFIIPQYELISQGYKCGRKGGLLIYLHELYKGTCKNLYRDSKHWEGLFIDVTSPILQNK